MTIAADYFDGQLSKKHPVLLSVHPGRIELTGDSIGGQRQFKMEDIEVNPRIGKYTKRVLQLPGGAVVEFDDDPTVELILAQKPKKLSFHALAYRLETKWRWALSALAATMIFSLFFLFYGIPFLAKTAANALPVEVDRSLGQGALTGLDKIVFTPSALPSATQKRIRAQFDKMTAAVTGDFQFQLEFRKGNKIGPNAFALPSGIIVITDEMIALAKNDREIAAVLAHEIGHVVHRHILRATLQDSAIGVLLAVVVGDASALSTLAAALPTVMLHSKFSRHFEEEADDFSLKYLQGKGLSPAAFADIMERLAKKMGEDTDQQDFLSSHPATGKRIKKFRDAAKKE